jgi:hypothetical protein
MNKHPRLNIQREDARLKKSAKELSQLARKFAPKWNQLSNHGKLATERSTARSLRAANRRVSQTSKRMGQILEWLDRVRQTEKHSYAAKKSEGIRVRLRAA